MHQTLSGGHLGLHCIATAILAFIALAGIEARQKDPAPVSSWTAFWIFNVVLMAPILAAFWL